MPPHDIPAEQASLGAALIDSGAPLPPSTDFYRVEHVRIAEGIESLRLRGAPVDLITLTVELREKGVLDECGGPGALAGLLEMVQSSSHASHYAHIVKERARERQALVLFQQFEECIERGKPMRALMPRFLKAFTKLNIASQEPTSMSDALDALAADIETGRHNERIFTGLDPLDEMLQGLRTQQVLAIGGAPATGKSALALQVAIHVACAYGPVGLISQEMRHDEVAERVAAQWTQRRVRSVTKDAPAVRDVSKALAGVHCPIYDWRMAPNDWAAHMRALKAAHPNMAAFVLDYVQLMKRDDGKAQLESKEHEFLGEVMPLAKGLSQELNCVGIVLAQLKAEARTAGIEPTGESFRGPAILENSDKALILWRPSDAQLMAKVVKNRQGPVGNVEVVFDGECVSFSAPGASRRPRRFPTPTAAPVAFDDIPI